MVDQPDPPDERGVDNVGEDSPVTDGEVPGAVDPVLLDDAALQAELAALLPMADLDALSDPLTLAMHLDPRVVSRPHLRVIAQAMAGLSADGGDRAAICTPPQVGKTWLAVWGVFWWLCRHPSHRVIIGSYATLLATKRGRAIRRLVQLHGYRYGLVLESGTAAANDWTLTTGGGVRSAGVDAGITGEPANFILIDDPVKGRAEADSPTTREKTWNWFSGDANSRLAPGAPILLIQTRWHEEDLFGRLVANEGVKGNGGRWRVVSMPAIAMTPDPERGIPPDGLGRAPGEPLAHPRIPTSKPKLLLKHWHEKRRSSTPRDWGSLYQCDPKPAEGALIHRDIMRRRRCFTPETAPVKHAVAVDPSGGGRDEAGIIGGWLGADRRVYLTHDLSGVMPTEDWAEKACQLAHETRAEKIICESNYGGDMCRRVIRAAWVDLVRRGDIPDGELPPAILTVHAKKGKLVRAEPIAQQFILDNVRLAAPLSDLEEQWCTWQATSPESPGRIDASAYLVYALLPIAALQGMAGTMSSAAGVSRSQAAGTGVSGMPVIPRGAGVSLSGASPAGVVLPFRRRTGRPVTVDSRTLGLSS